MITITSWNNMLAGVKAGRVWHLCGSDCFWYRLYHAEKTAVIAERVTDKVHLEVKYYLHLDLRRGRIVDATGTPVGIFNNVHAVIVPPDKLCPSAKL